MKTINYLPLVMLGLLFIESASSLFAQQYQAPIVAIETNSYDQHETAIACSPVNANRLMVGWNDFRPIQGNTGPKPGFAFSTNGGSNWQTGIVLPLGYKNGFDPSVAIDGNGYAYYCYIAKRDNSPADTVIGPVYVSRSTDLGTSWQHVRVSSDTARQDKPFITI